MADLLREFIFEPFEQVIGARLASVLYYILECDADGFDAARPSNTGLTDLQLAFVSKTLRVTWHVVPENDDSLAYGVRAFTAESRILGPDVPSVRADLTPLWSACLGSELTSVQVLGMAGVPLARRLGFGRHTAVVAIGYGGSALEVSDGDEILVLSEVEFAALRGRSYRRYDALGSYGKGG